MGLQTQVTEITSGVSIILKEKVGLWLGAFNIIVTKKKPSRLLFWSQWYWKMGGETISPSLSEMKFYIFFGMFIYTGQLQETRRGPLRRAQNSNFFIKTFHKLNIIFQKPAHYVLIYRHRISRFWHNLFFQLLVGGWWRKEGNFFAIFWFLKWKFVYILKNCYISSPELNSVQDNLLFIISSTQKGYFDHFYHPW